MKDVFHGPKATNLDRRNTTFPTKKEKTTSPKPPDKLKNNHFPGT